MRSNLPRMHWIQSSVGRQRGIPARLRSRQTFRKEPVTSTSTPAVIHSIRQLVDCFIQMQQDVTVVQTTADSAGISQCWHDSQGLLILGPPGSGTIQFGDTGVSISEHIEQDLLPYMTCCKCGNLPSSCSQYYDKHPYVDSSLCVSTLVSRMVEADPHFTTADGTSYTFNPIGEFIFLESADNVVQARISQFVDALGVPKPASYFSAFAMRYQQSDVIQVELSSTQFFVFSCERTADCVRLWEFGIFRVTELL